MSNSSWSGTARYGTARSRALPSQGSVCWRYLEVGKPGCPLAEGGQDTGCCGSGDGKAQGLPEQQQFLKCL